MADIASNWPALSGIENNWEDLRDPIDVNLRRYLVHYGERVAATGDSFNGDKTPDAHGLCRFSPDLFFIGTGLQNGNPFQYLVTDYIYASSQLNIGNWHPKQSAFAGYVAVTSDEGKLVLGRRDILICWMGTMLPIEWLEDTEIVPVLATEVFPINTLARVHQGFYSFYTSKDPDSTYNKTSARDQVLAAVRRFVDKYAKEDVSITVAGHSLGAALATLNSMDIVYNGYNKPTGSSSGFPVTAFAYACPRVGNKHFHKVFDGLSDLHLLRIRNANDIVPDYPISIDPVVISYSEVGVLLDIDTQNSPDTKTQTTKMSHDLNLYLYGIAAYQGKDKDLKLAIDFDLSILNKNNDLLKDESRAPPNWWTGTTEMDMVQVDSGFWKLKGNNPDPPTQAAMKNDTN